MSSKTEGNSHPILDRFLENPSEVFPPQQKSFVGRLVTWAGFSEADDQIRAMASEVESYHHTSADKIKELNVSSIVEKINSLDVEEGQKEAIHKQVTKIFMKSTYENKYEKEINLIVNTCAAQDIDKFFTENDQKTCDLFLQTLQDLPEKDRKNPEVVKFMMNLFTGGTCHAFLRLNPQWKVYQIQNQESITNLVKLFYLLGSNGKEASERITPLFQKTALVQAIAPPYFLGDVVAILAIKADPADRQQFLKDVAPLFQQTNSMQELLDVLLVVNAIPSVDRKQAIENTAPLLKSAGPYFQAHAAKAISSIPPPIQQEIVVALSACFQGKIDSNVISKNISSYISAIKVLGLNNFIQAAQDAAPILQSIKDGDMRFEIIILINQIPPEGRQKAVEALRSLDPRSSEEVQTIIQVAKKIGWEKFTEALRDAAPFSEDYLLEQRIDSIESVAEIPPESRQKVMDTLYSTDIPEILTDTPDAISATIRVIGAIGLEKFMEALGDVAPLIKAQGIDLNASILKSMADLPPTESRAEVVKVLCSTDILKDLLRTPAAVNIAIQGVGEIGLDDFIKAFHTAAPLLKIQEAFPTASDVKVGSIITAAQIPREYRQKVVDALCSEKTPPLKKHVDLAHIQKTLTLIPPEYSEKVLELVIAEKDNIASIFHLLVENEQSREALHNHLSQALEKAMVSSPESASELADKIIAHYESLGLHDEHPLYQQAINVKVLTDPDSAKGPKNPYTIYNNLLKGEPLVDFPVPSVKIEEGLFCSFDVQGLQSARKKLTFADLPKIDKQFLKKSFNALEARMQEELTLAETEQDQKRIKEISEQIEAIKDVKTNVLNAVLIPSLLKIEGKPHESIPQSSFQLYTVITYLTTLSNDRKTGQMLSDQEDELMLFAQCIVNCKTGQEDGLAEYYNGVLAKGFSNQPATEGSSLEAVKDFAEKSIQPILGRVFTDEKMFRKVMEFSSQQKVPQLVHQLGYLKNKIFAQIGWQHTVTFDEHSGWIMDELINKSAPELAEAFLREIAFSTAVDDFLERVNEALKASGKPAIGMVQIFEVLEKQLNPQNPDWSDPGDDNKGPGTRYFTFDEYGTPNGITRLAAAHLLIAAHYGKQTA